MEHFSNPFVGLRPFKTEESLLFFGRNEQTLDLLQRLHQHHFVAMVGGSGCGKSSLMRAGLIPSLLAGYLVNDRDHWAITTMKPGKSPLVNLAKAILDQLHPAANLPSVEDFYHKIRETGAIAIIDFLQPLWNEKSTNFFLLVDQFEELFRYPNDQNAVKAKDEAIDFVNIILELSSLKRLPIYVVITLRSDFIGDCDQFYGLPEAMNQSMYLLPRLNRVQLKTVIEGPVKLGGGTILPALTSQLMNDLGKVRDELPLLQHALMRMWDHNLKADKQGCLDLEDYKQVRGVEKALSTHADEVLDSMSPDDQALTKKIFQALTGIDENKRKIRRPVSRRQLIALTGSGEEQVGNIIDLYTMEERSFLVVSKANDADDEVVDISHESLIRQWNTLSKWVDEEAEAALKYLQLAETVSMYGQKNVYLSESQLKISVDWRDTFNPAAAWAQRYNADFEGTMAYLKKCEEEDLRGNRIKQIQRLAIYTIIGILFIAAITVAVVLYQNYLKTEAAYKRADCQKLKADSSAMVAKLQRLKADSAAHVATCQKLKADSATQVAIFQKQKADNAANEVRKQKNIVQANYLVTAMKSIVKSDPTTALRLAEEAFKKHHDPGIQSDAVKIYRENSFYRIIGTHEGSVNSVAWSPDGTTILTGSFDKTARLWDMNGKLIREFSGHNGGIRSLAFSPDGKTILTGSFDKTARLWDLNGNTIREFTGHTDGVKCVAYSPDGKTILTGSFDKTARLWDLNGTMIREFKGHKGTITSLVFSGDGSTVLTGSEDKTARMWDLKGNLICEFPGHTEGVSSVAVSPDGKTVLSGSARTARLWDMKGNMIREFKGHSDVVSSVAFSPDGKTVLTGSADKTARLWDMKGNMIQEFTGHAKSVVSIAFSPNGQTILTGSDDHTARLWELQKKALCDFKGHAGEVTSVAFSPGGDLIVTGSFDKTARLWDTRGNMIMEFDGHAYGAVTVACSPDGKAILTGSFDKTARLWDLRGNMISEFTGHANGIVSVCFSPADKRILTGSFDKTARLWDFNGHLIRVFKGHTDGVTSVAFSPDGKTILTGSEDHTARLWDPGGNMTREFGGSAENGHTDDVSSVAFSPDGKTILTGSYDKTARLWDLRGNLIQVFTGHAEGVSAVAFSPKGKTVLTGSVDQTAILWDLQGNILQIFKGHSGKISTVAFSPDGKTVLTGSDDHTARLWETVMPLDDFLERRKIEPLSPGQKEKFGIR